jgi:S1-C subfamily serine protease
MKVKSNIISFILGMAVTILLGAGTYQFALSTDNLFVNGVKVDKTLFKYDGSNVLPLRATAEALGLDVEYTKGRIDLNSKLTDLETVVKNCKDSCVMIYCYDNTGKAVSQGSGFVYKSNGSTFVVTAKHVTDKGTQYIVFSDDSIYGIEATLQSVETDLDVAVLKVNADLPSVVLGDSERLVEGCRLVSISSPKGIQNTIDECLYTGISLSRSKPHLGISESEMNVGSSGGAIFNYQGELIGMNVLGEGNANDAIPINDMKSILVKLK